jgi:glucitol operon activator protein
MDSTTTVLILIAVAAWLLQIAMGWLQIRRFNQAFAALPQDGRIGVGKNSGRFKAKVIIALSFDRQDCVQDGFIMRGYTVFASPKKLTELNGLKLSELNPEKLFPNDEASQAALTIAIQPKK